MITGLLKPYKKWMNPLTQMLILKTIPALNEHLLKVPDVKTRLGIACGRAGFKK